MPENTTTQRFLFPDIFPKTVVAQFDQRQGSSDGGAILLKAADRRLRLTRALAACLVDNRQPGKVEHETEELLAQRVYGLACGYADANDAARLAQDPVHKMLVGRDPVEGADLASQPTLSRFENAADRKQLYRMGEALAEAVIERNRPQENSDIRRWPSNRAHRRSRTNQRRRVRPGRGRGPCQAIVDRSRQTFANPEPRWHGSAYCEKPCNTSRMFDTTAVSCSKVQR